MLRNYIIKMIMISEVMKKLKQLKIEIEETKTSHSRLRTS